MSKEEETITITYVTTVKEAKRISQMTGYDTGHKEACLAALEAHRSKYDKYLSTLVVPWRHSGRYIYDSEHNKTAATLDCEAKLMAAAPKMLEALILAEGNMAYSDWSLEDSCRGAIRDTIRAAVPEDVADEILGEE